MTLPDIINRFVSTLQGLSSYDSDVLCGPERVIQLPKLYQNLTAETQPKDEVCLDNLKDNVSFYGNWFPEETCEQFNQAHDLFENTEVTPPFIFMGFEFIGCPSPEKYLQWLEKYTDEFINDLSKYGYSLRTIDDLNGVVVLASKWNNKLTVAQKKRVAGAFLKIYNSLDIESLKLVDLSNRADGLVLGISVLADVSRISFDFFDKSSKEDPKVILEKAVTAMEKKSSEISGDDAKKIYSFLTSQLELADNNLYPKAWKLFVLHRPEYALKLVEESPETLRKILREERITISPDKTENGTNSLKPLIMERYVDLLEGKGRRTPQDYPLFLVVAPQVFLSLAREWGVEKTIEWLDNELASHNKEGMDRIEDILMFLVEDPKINARQLLKSKKCYIPFFERLEEGLVNAAAAMNGISKSISFSNFRDYVQYHLVYNGMEDVLISLYKENHTYAPIFSLPKDIRPTGKGLSFVSIDLYPDIEKNKHPDKKNVKIIKIKSHEWADNTHGILTSSLAVGDKIGLAPEARLYVITKGTNTENLARSVLEALKAAKALKKKDPGVSVIGLSLGLTFPYIFRKIVEQSEIYKEMTQLCEELHKMGVAIIVSAGNSGGKLDSNMLGYLPHVKLVGGIDSRGTQTIEDDVESHYSSGGDYDNHTSFWAHSDPVITLAPIKGGFWLDTGGTSSAQPFVSATILLLKDVNPTLSLEECYKILDETSYPLKTDDRIGIDEKPRGINPMKAILEAAKRPGSRYSGDRLKKLEEFLQLQISSTKPNASPI